MSDFKEVWERPEIETDHWLYALEVVLGFDHPASRKAEELRVLINYFVGKGLRFPAALPQPDDPYADGRRGVRVCLGKIKLPVSVAFEIGNLTDEDKRAAKKLHRLANEIRSILGKDDPPEALLSGGPRHANTY